jgi:L-alanine-DL-glutamate epimerase-like enolase superfamily enzyme
VKDATSIPVCSGENLFGLRGYRPYFEARALDVVMVDVPWNGFAQSRKIADLAESYELNIAPHNYYSHLSTLHSAHLCASIPNVRIMEIDVDDVPWKDALVDVPPVVRDGQLVIPTRPGWGADLDEAVARQHVWEPGRLPGYSDPAMYRR